MTTIVTAPLSSTDPGWNFSGVGTNGYDNVEQTYYWYSKNGDIAYAQAIPQMFAATVGDVITWQLDVFEALLGSLVTEWHIAIREDATWSTVAEHVITSNVYTPQHVTVEHTVTLAANYYVIFHANKTANGAAARFEFRTNTFNVTKSAPAAPTITTTALGPLVVAEAASVQLDATGTPPITWTVSAGALPAGLTLSSAGAITGTPTTAGPYDVTVTATNGNGTDTQQYTGTVDAAPTPPTITTTALGPLVAAEAASVQLDATGTPPITWTVSAGALPAGLTLSSAGAITGTPTTAGPYDVTVTATNGGGTDTQQYTGTVDAAPVVVTARPIGTRLRDRITLWLGVNRPATEGTPHAAKAIVWPLSADEIIAFEGGYRDTSMVTYRVLTVWPDVIAAATTEVDWRGLRYQVDGPSMQCTDGNGVLHHQEFVMKRVTG